MSKVIMEFDSDEDRFKLNAIFNIDKLQYSLCKLSELRGKIINNKFYNDELISIKDNKVIDTSNITDYKEVTKIYENSKEYIDKLYIENILEEILEPIYDYIDC